MPRMVLRPSCLIMTGRKAFTASVASTGNIGPGFGEVGSLANFSAMPIVVKIVYTLQMLLGRLEIFGLLQFFLMKWWR